MEVLSFSHVRQNLKTVLDDVADNRRAVRIHRRRGRDVVLLDIEEYERLLETAHLLGSQANARQLIDAVVELNAGGGAAHEMHDLKPADT